MLTQSIEFPIWYQIIQTDDDHIKTYKVMARPFPSRHPRQIGVQRTIFQISRCNKYYDIHIGCIVLQSTIPSAKAWCRKPKLMVDHNRRSQTNQITTKFRSDNAILHEIAWRSQRWPSRLLLDQQRHTFQKSTLRIVLSIVEGAPKEIYFHTPFQYQSCKQIFWTSRS